MYLVMLETNGNQRYIFSSPRLRENIGASAQLVRLKEWTDTALKDTGADAAWQCNGPAPHTSTGISSSGKDDDASEPWFIAEHPQWVSRASGKVIFMVKTEDLAKAVIGQVTRTALAQAPGIDVSGVYLSMGDQSAIDEDLLKRIHAEAAAYALRRSPAHARFPQMPFLARAKDSSLPAAPPLRVMLPDGLKDEAADDLATAQSLASRIQRYQAYPARKHLIKLASKASSVLNLDNEARRLVRDPTKLMEAYKDLRNKTNETTLLDALQTSFATGLAAETINAGAESTSNTQDVRQLEHAFQDGDQSSTSNLELSKVAVIHADGNGVGAIMRNLLAAMQCVPPKEFETELGCSPHAPDAFRRFTLAVSGRLDQAVTQAFASAWADVSVWAQIEAWLQGKSSPVVPVVPVILGGDDVTVITSGDYALPFAASFLGHFEKQTQADSLLKYLHAVGKVATGLLKPEAVTSAPMTAAAGVAVVRRNFPFHIAYELAEKLVGRAKAVGKNQASPCSTLDFHVLFDTTVIDPDAQLGSHKDFTQRPFRLESAAETQPPSADASESREAVTWKDTCCRVARFKGFQHTDDEKDQIEPFPRTRAARIRKLLSDGKQDEAAKHWETAKAVVSIDSDIAGGGPEQLFDLLELTDLLPCSYLQHVTGLTRRKDSTSARSMSEEAQS